MGAMKEDSKRMTHPSLFQKPHVDDSGQGGVGEIMKSCNFLPMTNNISDFSSSSTISMSRPPPVNNICMINDRQGKMKKKLVRCPTMESSTYIKAIKPKEYLLKNLAASNDFKAPRDLCTIPQANTDLSLQFCANSSNKTKGEASSSKTHHMNNPHVEELPSENGKQNGSPSETGSDLTSTRGVVINEPMKTQKKLKTLLQDEQVVSEYHGIQTLFGMSVASNDCAKRIGIKRFLRIRAHILHQQKIFSEQVFELHRLIKVQKMVSKSPNLVFRSGGTMRSSHQLEMAPSLVKKRNTEIQRPLVWSQRLAPPLPSPGNQWLVPVMSPSEGLVYKPYTGPFPPPPSAFIVPNFGHHSPNTTFNFHVSPKLNHSYYPQPNTKSPLDKTNPSGQNQRWSSTSSYVTQAIPNSLKKCQEFDESIGSSLSVKHEVNVLNLFPTEPDYKQKQKL